MVRTWERVALKAFGVSTYSAEVESVAELTGWYRRITFSSPEFVELLSRVETAGRSVYGWAAGEKLLVRSVRAAFRDGLGLGRSEYFAQSYWIRTG